MAKYFNLNKTIISNRLENGLLHAQCSITSTQEEASAWIAAEPYNFRITGAALEVYRSLQEECGYRELTELIGTEFFVNSGTQLKALIDPEQKLARDLFTECMKGIIQVQPFVYRERGFASPRDYLDEWNRFNQGNCYAYNVPDGIKLEDYTYMFSIPRHYNLFNRSHMIHVEKNETQNKVAATFIDTYQEINVSFAFDTNFVIRSANADFIRFPHDACPGSAPAVQNLVGLDLRQLNKKEIIAQTGGKQNCIHIADIVDDACRFILSL